MTASQNSYKVSVCIPAYNYPHLLHRCLQSIVNQTYTNIEIVVTDDSNTNQLQEVVDAFQDSRILYYKNEQPLGSPANWNAAIKKASGDLIKILHHDDYFTHTNAIATFVNAFEQQPDILFWFSKHYNDFSGKKIESKLSAKLVAKIEQFPSKLLLMNVIGAPSVTMLHKEVVHHILFDEKTHWMVDVIFYIDVLRQFRKIGFIQEPLVSITAGSALQVTNTTNGIRKIEENIYAYNRYHLFNSHKFSLIDRLYFTELIKRYALLQNNTWWEQLDKETQTALQLSRKLAYLPVWYKLLALIRRTWVQYF